MAPTADQTCEHVPSYAQVPGTDCRECEAEPDTSNGCVECDDPVAPNVILTASQGGTVEKRYCRRCYLMQP